jgi:sRNA-binding protein
VAHARPSVNKRLRETQKKEKQAQKAERRAARAEEKKTHARDKTASEDPDIAGIVPGPQPVPWADELTEDEK